MKCPFQPHETEMLWSFFLRQRPKHHLSAACLFRSSIQYQPKLWSEVWKRRLLKWNGCFSFPFFLCCPHLCRCSPWQDLRSVSLPRIFLEAPSLLGCRSILSWTNLKATGQVHKPESLKWSHYKMSFWKSRPHLSTRSSPSLLPPAA